MKTHYLILALILVTLLGIWIPCFSQNRTKTFDHVIWSRNATIYEVNIRQFTPEGTFKALEKHLPRLQKMGVDILWLMPINPLGEKNRKGTLGSYYAVRNYLAVNPEYGTMQDFKTLVKKAHDLGMKVIVDWVANHTAWDNKLINDHPDWYKKNDKGNIIPPVADWTDVAGLDYTRPGLRKYMADALCWWIKEANIDGYRCDVAGMLPVSFWNQAVPQMKKIKPIFMLAEDETPQMHDTAFDATYSWEFHNMTDKIAQGKKGADALDSLYSIERKAFPADAYRMRFTSNHDENSWDGSEYERMGDAVKTFAVLTFTFPGIPLIYSGQESAMRKRLRFFDKDTIPWGNYPLEQFYSKLTRLKKRNSLLNSGSVGAQFIKVSSSNDKAVYAFLRKDPKQKLFVVLNLTAKEQMVQFSGKEFTGPYKELFSGHTKRWKPGDKEKLAPWEYRVYESE